MSIFEMKDILSNFAFLVEDARLDLSAMGTSNENGEKMFELLEKLAKSLNKSVKNIEKVEKLIKGVMTDETL